MTETPKPGLKKGFVSSVNGALFEFQQRLDALTNQVEESKKCIAQIHDGQAVIRTALENNADCHRKSQEAEESISKMHHDQHKSYQIIKRIVAEIDSMKWSTNILILCTTSVFVIQLSFFFLR